MWKQFSIEPDERNNLMSVSNKSKTIMNPSVPNFISLHRKQYFLSLNRWLFVPVLILCKSSIHLLRTAELKSFNPTLCSLWLSILLEGEGAERAEGRELRGAVDACLFPLGPPPPPPLPPLLQFLNLWGHKLCNTWIPIQTRITFSRAERVWLGVMHEDRRAYPLVPRAAFFFSLLESHSAIVRPGRTLSSEFSLSCFSSKETTLKWKYSNSQSTPKDILPQ